MNENEVIDTNVVEIKFDNSQFVENVAQTIATVNELKESLQFDSNSFDSLERATRNIDLSGISSSLESLSDRFSTFGIIGMTAVQRITNEVMTLGGKLMKLVAKPWQQIITGGTNRAANIAQAQFQLEGLFGKTDEGLAKLNMTMKASSDEITKLTGLTDDMIVAMNAADYAVADTAYGLDSAAKAASVLATSGVDVLHFSEDLKDANGLMRTEMQVALRSISGTAAMANASYDEIAHVFERISGNGRVMAIDLQSLSARGLNAAATLRDYLNEIGVTANATEKDIRDMVSKGEIDFMTFAKAMDSTYGDHAKDANNTFTGAFSNMKFALSKIGADFIGPFRDKMIPLLNDVRISINQVRKALNFKIKFPGLEEEASIVELFTRAITNLSAKFHDLFTVWSGGQNVLENTMSAISQLSGMGFGDVKQLFDSVTNGTIDGKKAVSELISYLSRGGADMKKVYSELADQLETTEDEVYRMCHNGEISFEQLSNAISAAFGNIVAETRISQLAEILKNVLSTAVNLANGISSIVGPVIEAFFDVFTENGITGIIGITQAISDFTAKLRLSVPAQRNLVRVFTAVFRVFKTGISVVLKLASGLFKIISAFAPLIDVVITFAAIIAEVVVYIVNFIADSKLLGAAVRALTVIFIYAGRVIVAVLVTIIALVSTAISGIAYVFRTLANSIRSVDLTKVYELIQSVKALVYSFMAGGMIPLIQRAITAFITAVGLLFVGIATAFANLKDTMVGAVDKIKNGGVDLINAFTMLGEKIQTVFMSVYEFIKTRFVGLASVVAVLESLLAFGVLYNVLRVGSAITRAVTSWANKNNAAALSSAADAIKKVAVAFLIFSAAIVALNFVDPNKLWNILFALGGFVLIVAGAAFAIKKIIDSVTGLKKAENELKSWEKVMASFMQTCELAIDRLSRAFTKFLSKLGNSAMFIGLAVLIASIAGSIYILSKAVGSWADIPSDKIWSGLVRMGAVLLGFTVALSILGSYCKKAGSGMIGAAVFLLAFTTVLKNFYSVVEMYADLDRTALNKNGGGVEKTLIRLGSVMLGLAVAVALIGAACKKAGFGMMAGAIDMLAFIIVLKQMKDIIEEYAELDRAEFWSGAARIGAILLAFGLILALMGESLGTSKGFSASFKNGINYKKSSQNLIGIVLSLLAMAVVLEAFADVVSKIANEPWQAWLETILVLIVSLGGICAAIKLLDGTKATSIAGLSLVIFTISMMIAILSILDPIRALSGATSILMVLYALGNCMAQMAAINQMSKRNVTKTLVAALISLAGVTLMLALLANNDWSSIIAAGIAIGVVLSSLSESLSKTKNLKKLNNDTILSMLAVLSMVGMAVAILAQVPVKDVASLLSLTVAFSIIAGVMSAVTQMLSKVGSVNKDAVTAFATLTTIMTVMSMFMAFSAKIVGNDIAGLVGIVGAMSLLSFVIVAIVALLNVIKVHEGILKGVGAFFLIMTIISVYALAMAGIAKVGDVSDTTYLINNMVISMTAMIPFLVIMSMVLAMVGNMGPAILLGNVMFLALMMTITLFVRLMAGIAQIGNVDQTISILEAVSESLRSLTVTMLLLIAVGALAIPAIVGVGLLQTMVVSMLVLFGIVGAIQGINTAVTLGVGLIMFACTSLITLSQLMTTISLGGISTLLMALQMINSINVLSLIKLGLVTSGLAMATAPLLAIGMAKNKLNAALKAIKQMMLDLVFIFTNGQLLGRMQVDDIKRATEDTLKVVDAMTAYASRYTVSGYAHGLVNSDAQKILEAGAIGMASIVDNAFRDYMGIHSDSDLSGIWAHFTDTGYAHSLTDPSNLSIVSDGVTDLGEFVNTTGIDVMSQAGENTGISFITGLLSGVQKTDLASNLGSLFNEAGTAFNHAANVTSQRVSIVNGRKIHHGTSHGDNSATNPGNRPYFSPAVSDIEEMEDSSKGLLDYGDTFTNLLKELEDSLSNLGTLSDSASASLDGLGGSMGGVGSSASELSNKLDDLMERYEDRWETAKERANKDLFKGVDDQGDDFLGKVQDIMDEYAKIYESAVEKTNSQDLFAEVKEEDESFAPDTLLRNLEDQVNQINELNTIISSLSGRIADKNLAAAISNMDVDDLPQLRALYRMNAGQLAEYEQMYQNKVAANQHKIQNELSGELSQLTGSTVDVASYVATDASTNRLLKNLEAQVNQLNEYNATVASLMARIKDVHLREAIATMGVDSIEELKLLNSMTDAQLDEYIALYNRKIDEGVTSVKNELSAELSALMGQPLDIEEFYNQYEAGLYNVADMIAAGSDGAKAIGSNTSSQIGAGMADSVLNEVKAEDAYAAGKGYTEALANGIKDPDAMDLLMSNLDSMANQIVEVLCEHYNEDFTYAGRMIVETILKGIEEAQDTSFDESIDVLSQRIIDKIDAFSDKFMLVGKNIVLGIKQGILSPEMVKQLEAAAMTVAAKALQAAKTKLKIKSPSRAFMEIGKYVDEGFAIGLRDYSNLVSNEAGEVVDGSMSAIQEAIQQLSGMLDGSIDVNPVITPTLDLSEVSARSAALSEMFNGRQIAIQARNDEQQAEMLSKFGDIIAEQNDEPKSIVFNQTNNSPKALSRTEIYRQSRNAFSQLANAVT